MELTGFLQSKAGISSEQGQVIAMIPGRLRVGPNRGTEERLKLLWRPGGSLVSRPAGPREPETGRGVVRGIAAVLLVSEEANEGAVAL